jgi:hypothetical protein
MRSPEGVVANQSRRASPKFLVGLFVGRQKSGYLA